MRPSPILRAGVPTRLAARRRLVLLVGDRSVLPGGVATLAANTAGRRVMAGTAGALAAATAGILAGPVAAAVAGFYGAVLLSTVLARWRDRAARSARAVAVDAVAALAADLRAGLAPARALAEALPALRGAHDPAVTLAAERVAIAWVVAERLGAPLADLLERVEAELRAADQLQLRVAAETAGVRLTAGLLAALPVVGILLGYGWGVDPLALLLHTAYGSACALAALALQGVGMAWTGRMCRRVSTAAA